MTNKQFICALMKYISRLDVEEIADFFMDVDLCPPVIFGEDPTACMDDCKACWMIWLNSEHEKEELDSNL